MKRFLRAPWMTRILCWLIAVYIRLVNATSRFETVGAERPRRLWDAGTPFILAFWHGRLLMAPMAWRRGASMNMLISSHADGRIIAGAIGHFGLGTVTGSSSQGGTGALRAVLKALKAGENVGFTPDGPRGPAMRASTGVVAAARLSGAPILPLAYATTHRRVLGSWDRFHLALPFSRGVFVWGDPVSVARDAEDAEVEQARLEVEDRLNRITAEADRRCGHAPVQPADAA
ncbi:MAG TPA: lysophospholipid acyltransferase family protein [Stellaceae bacterium]|nr:lysophospholipid acyltransferase family protein [Stellaceae bacterium]